MNTEINDLLMAAEALHEACKYTKRPWTDPKDAAAYLESLPGYVESEGC